MPMSERDLKIGFGTLFSVSGEGKRKDVVVGVGKKGYFFTAQVFQSGQGRDWIYHSGTAGKDNIQEIVGQLTLQQVIEALEEGTRQVGLKEINQEMKRILVRESRKKSRLLE